jgi:P27 family predicted phage terminase small subunit
MSNPPVPFPLKVLRGNPGKRPLRAEPEPAREPQCPEAPSYLRGYAIDEWYAVAPEVWRLGLLTVIDIAALAAYCDAYFRWRLAREALARMTERDPITHGLLIKNVDGSARRNPLAKVVADAGVEMLSAAVEFGLTPIARARLGAAGIGGQPGGSSKFDGLIGPSKVR